MVSETSVISRSVDRKCTDRLTDHDGECIVFFRNVTNCLPLGAA